MKKRVLILAGLCVALIVICISCAKDSNKPDDPNTPAPSNTAKFTWTKGNSSGTADDAYVVNAYNEIYATKSGGIYVDIILDALSKGSYTISPSAGISLEYSDGSATFTGKSGTVTITESTATTVSGNFNCTFSSGGSISGEFSNLPKK